MLVLCIHGLGKLAVGWSRLSGCGVSQGGMVEGKEWVRWGKVYGHGGSEGGVVVRVGGRVCCHGGRGSGVVGRE